MQGVIVLGKTRPGFSYLCTWLPHLQAQVCFSACLLSASPRSGVNLQPIWTILYLDFGQTKTKTKVFAKENNLFYSP